MYAISARSRSGLESRSRRDRVRAARPPKAVATYLTVRSGSCRYDLSCESCWAARGGANGARPRAHPLWVRAAGRGNLPPRGRVPFGTPRADQDTSWRYRYLQEPQRTLR